MVEVHKGLEGHKGNKVRLVEVLVGGAGKQHTRLLVLHMLVPLVPVQCMQDITLIDQMLTSLAT